MRSSLYPSLYQINTRVWLTELSQALGRPATLDDIPDAELDRLARDGLRLGLVPERLADRPGRPATSRGPTRNGERNSRRRCPISREEDILGSGFAITGYTVQQSLGGDAALARLRQRLRKRGLRLMLDFVPNHTGLDHPGSKNTPSITSGARNRTWPALPRITPGSSARRGDLLLAYGRDPYFAGWPDTLQLNYGNPATQEAMIGELVKIAGQCDGVRCDMAMLVLPEVFERTWGIPAKLFWPEATRRVREKVPGFCFMAEVYWDMEWTMQQQGFDYAYDKRLYDRLREGHARPVREHFHAGLDYQNKLARFLENHDEPRAAATFPAGQHEAAAVITFLSPGLAFLPPGPIRRAAQTHLSAPGPRPDEAGEPAPAGSSTNGCSTSCASPPSGKGSGNCSNASPRGTATGPRTRSSPSPGRIPAGARLLVAVNYAGHPSQCYVRLPVSRPGRPARCGCSDLLGAGLIRARRERPGLARPLPGSAALGLPRLRPFQPSATQPRPSNRDGE